MSEVKRREENLLLRPPVVCPPLACPSVLLSTGEKWRRGKNFFFRRLFMGKSSVALLSSREKKTLLLWRGEKSLPFLDVGVLLRCLGFVLLPLKLGLTCPKAECGAIRTSSTHYGTMQK